ncbi:hypothetical protein BC834DRAFT_850299 [Gloeopeniophorella convolvens]|nr:hypothetical protein BC834DRAFT_850299 [Gloeopeniophorella convolvens]
MYSRGRSRDISPAALARQASEERRRNRSSAAVMDPYPLPSDPEKHLARFYLPPASSSPSPITTPLALTPPDPTPVRARPRARFVQLEELHAPIDPRQTPSSVQVIKSRPLSFPVQPRKVLPPPPPQPSAEELAQRAEAAQRAREQARARRRYETLARAEQLFATTLARSRRERLAALMTRARQEEELKERERATRELERLEQQRERHPTGYIPPTPRSTFRVLARVPPSQPQQRPEPDRFTYAFPIASTSSSANSVPMRARQASPKTRVALAALTDPNAVNVRSVPFEDVRASMRGALFFAPPNEEFPGRSLREAELLGTLLEAVHWEEGERWRHKGKAKAWVPQLPDIVPECEACASASLPLDGLLATSSQLASSPSASSASTSLSVASRPISWLSFGSRKSVSSVTTAHTTPPPTIKELPSSSELLSVRHSCGRARGQCFIAVDVEDSPLGSGVDSPPAPAPAVGSANVTRSPPHRRPRKSSLSARTWLAFQSSMTSMISAAARAQRAYVSATIAGLATTDYATDRSCSPSDPSPERARHPPNGWRAQSCDVAKFTSSAHDADKCHVPYLVFELIESESAHSHLASELPNGAPGLDANPGHTPNAAAITIPPTYYSADRHIFNPNPIHLLSRAQINSWRFRGAPGAMPAQVFCRPEVFYRLEAAGGTSREARGGSALRWSWRVVWDTEDAVEG